MICALALLVGAAMATFQPTPRELRNDRALIHMLHETIDTRERADLAGFTALDNARTLGRAQKRMSMAFASALSAQPLAYFADNVDARKLVLVHTRRVLRAAERDELIAALPTLTFEHYLPHNTWIEAVTADQAQFLLQHDYIDWVKQRWGKRGWGGPRTERHGRFDASSSSIFSQQKRSAR